MYGDENVLCDIEPDEPEINDLADRIADGGAWFYVEADNGFPLENIRALLETIAQWR